MVTSIEPILNPNGRYSIKETCELLGIHRNTLRSYVKAGYIKCVIKTHGIRFRGFDILKFWNSFV